MHVSPVRKGFVKRLEDYRWPSYNNAGLGKAMLPVCPIQIDDPQLPLRDRA